MDNLFNDTFRMDSTRMKGWDYSSPGKYFVTICTKDRICYFGDVVDGKMHLSEMGKVSDCFWKEIPEHFPNAGLDAFQIMPNHIHGIVVIKDHNNKNYENASNVGSFPFSFDFVETLHATSLQNQRKRIMQRAYKINLQHLNKIKIKLNNNQNLQIQKNKTGKIQKTNICHTFHLNPAL